MYPFIHVYITCIYVKLTTTRNHATTRVPKNTYPVRADEHTLSDYCMCSNITALQLLVFCTAHACLASLSSLMEAEPEISSAAHAHTLAEGCTQPVALPSPLASLEGVVCR